ncbi:unnamed protein product [Trichobilharzia szidati]|nr:unnamed protein product [Trichobilharzia szidati]
MQCDCIIYNIKDDYKAIDDALWILEKLHDNLDKFAAQKQFILISSVLTWAKSSLPDPNDREMPFTDDDYLRRKAHSNYEEHILAEKSVIQQGKTAAWNSEPFLQFPGDRNNIVPTIHLRDLTRYRFCKQLFLFDMVVFSELDS